MTQVRGEYIHQCKYPDTSTDTVQLFPERGGPELPEIVIRTSFWDQNLILKPFGRFKIPGAKVLTTLGLNTDTPTLYGTHKRVKDTLILRYKYSIQHFNKLAPKRRIKTKLSRTDRFIIREDGRLETSLNCFWEKELPKRKR